MNSHMLGCLSYPKPHRQIEKSLYNALADINIPVIYIPSFLCRISDAILDLSDLESSGVKNMCRNGFPVSNLVNLEVLYKILLQLVLKL